MSDKKYIAIDLKSFYASVECVERGLDPLATNLVVADNSRTDKTICLAVSPSLKKCGISGRPRLFEVIQKAREYQAKTGRKLNYLVAPPRMQLYIEYSSKIYQIYLKYISAEDIHVYSIDEVFMDITNYLSLYRNAQGKLLSARELTILMIKDVLKTTGITATAGIGTNLYLAKIAMDIVAKRLDADEDGVRIAELDEIMYRKLLWGHRPLTDFWRIGNGISKKLEQNGMNTMGDVAKMSVSDFAYGKGEDLLFKLFGIDAELLIDHAWGVEPCLMEDIKVYRPVTNSLSSGQVLSCSYSYEKGQIIVKEMVELLTLELIAKKLCTDLVILDIGYDKDLGKNKYCGPMVYDAYGRKIPKPVHGSFHFQSYTSSSEKLWKTVLEIYKTIVDKSLSIRRVTITFANIVNETKVVQKHYEQMNLFTDYKKQKFEEEKEKKEKKIKESILEIQLKYGKNAILKGTNLLEGATTIERNQQIGGHKA